LAFVHIGLALPKVVVIKISWKEIEFSAIVITNTVISTYPDVASTVLRYVSTAVIYKPVAGIKNGKGIQLSMTEIQQ
jgi:hypothetical protein